MDEQLHLLLAKERMVPDGLPRSTEKLLELSPPPLASIMLAHLDPREEPLGLTGEHPVENGLNLIVKLLSCTQRSQQNAPTGNVHVAAVGGVQPLQQHECVVDFVDLKQGGRSLQDRLRAVGHILQLELTEARVLADPVLVEGV